MSDTARGLLWLNFAEVPYFAKLSIQTLEPLCTQREVANMNAPAMVRCSGHITSYCWRVCFPVYIDLSLSVSVD